jgi:hypothetical protein
VPVQRPLGPSNPRHAGPARGAPAGRSSPCARAWRAALAAHSSSADGGAGSQTPARTRASTLPSSVRAARSSQPPPHPQPHAVRSCSVSSSRRPLTLNRSRKARVPLLRMRVSIVPARICDISSNGRMLRAHCPRRAHALALVSPAGAARLPPASRGAAAAAIGLAAPSQSCTSQHAQAPPSPPRDRSAVVRAGRCRCGPHPARSRVDRPMRA